MSVRRSATEASEAGLNVRRLSAPGLSALDLAGEEIAAEVVDSIERFADTYRDLKER
jgi:hypothetical protein